MKKILCALATLAFIGSINVVSADDSTRFRLNGNSIYDQPYGCLLYTSRLQISDVTVMANQQAAGFMVHKK